MTYGDLLDRWRDEIVADKNTDRWPDADGAGYLATASEEIANGLELIPITDLTVTLADGDSTIVMPASFLSVDLYGVAVNGIVLDPEPLSVVWSKMTMPKSRYPRYYNYSPGDTGISFSPSIDGAVAAGGVKLTGKSIYTGSTTAGDDVWDGLYPAFHHLVLYLAGVYTFNAAELHARSQYFAQLFNTELQKFAAILHKTDITNMMVSIVQRNDPGSLKPPERVVG